MAGNERKVTSNDGNITPCDVEVVEIEIKTTSVETQKSREASDFRNMNSNGSLSEIMNDVSSPNGTIAPVGSPRGCNSASNEIVLKDFEEEEILNEEIRDPASEMNHVGSGIAANDISGLLEQFFQYEEDASPSHEENALNFPTPAASPSESCTEQNRFQATPIQCKQMIEVVEPTPPITPTCSHSSLESLDKKSLSDDSCSGISLGKGDLIMRNVKQEDPLESMNNCLLDQAEEGEICDEADQANLTSPQRPVSFGNGSLANAPLLSLLASKARLITNSRDEKYNDDNWSFNCMTDRTKNVSNTDDKTIRKSAVLSSEAIKANENSKGSSDSKLKGDSRHNRRSSSSERRPRSRKYRSHSRSSSSSRSRSRSLSPVWRRSRRLNKSNLPSRSEKRLKSTSRSPVRTALSRKPIPAESRRKRSRSPSGSRSRSPSTRPLRPRSRSWSRSRSRSESRTPSPRRSGWERSPNARSSIRHKRFCTDNGYHSKCCSKLRGRRSSVSSVDSCSSCSCCDDVNPKNSKTSRLRSAEQHEKGADRSRKRTYSSMSDDDHLCWSKKMARLDDASVKGSESDKGGSTRHSARPWATAGRRQPQARTKPPSNKFRFSFNKNYDEDVHKKMTELAAPVPYDIEKERKLKFLLGNERDSADFQRRNVYAGGIPNGSTKRDIERRFDSFGPIEKITLHFRERGDNYAFIVFKYPEDAARAIRDGNEDPYSRKLDLCFGGRRKFVGGSYVDFDGNASYLHQMDSGNCEQSRSPSPEMDFDSLLKMAREDVGK